MTMNETPGTVLVVGAGPAGMVAALELSRFGIPVRLVEKTAEPATTSRAISVQARTLELFEQRGIAAPLVELGNKGPYASIYGGGKRVFRLDYQSIDSKFNYTLYVSQADTERILREALEKAGVKTERNVTMTAFAQQEQDTGVSAVLQHGDGKLEQFSCTYMIDAEGAHSVARATLGLQFKGKSLEDNYALGDLHVEGDLPPTDLHIFSSEFGFMGMFPLGNERFRIIASNPISKPSKDTEPSQDELQQIYDQRSHIPARFYDMSWSSWFRINSRMIHHLNVGRVFLGGDSAHIHSPAGGQGMNTGMQDMINLSWKLAMVMKGQAKPELLETYHADRVPVIENVLTKTENLTDTIGSESTLFRSVFNHLAPWIVSIESVEHNSTEHMSQLANNYRDSPLSVSDGHAGSLHGGDRMPDLPVTLLNREGFAGQQPQPSTIFELMDPSAFTLFYSHIENPAKTHSEIQTAIGEWHYLMRGHQIAPPETAGDTFKKLFGSSPSIILVRPDGYIAFTGTDKSVPKLAKFCDKWLEADSTQAKPKAKNQEATHA